MNINFQKISSVFSKITLWLLACVISFFFIVFFNLDFGDKARCLDTGRCGKEGLSISAQSGLTPSNEENCLKHGYKWSGDFCDLNKREMKKVIEEKEKQENKEEEESIFLGMEVFLILLFSITTGLTVLFFIFLPILLIMFYADRNTGPPNIFLKISVGLMATLLSLYFPLFPFFGRSQNWQFFFYNLLNLFFLGCLWTALFKKMESGCRAFYVCTVLVLWVVSCLLYQEIANF